MAVDPRRRARQLARKAAKRKAQVAAKRKRGMGSAGLGEFLQVSGMPLHECYMPEALFQTGIGDVVISRARGATVYAGVFMVDVFCLGVKNAFLTVLQQEEFADMINRFRERERMIAIHPTCARKLVEEAAAYATDLGFAPHKDYKKAKIIFGDIDPGACRQTFAFGKDGKPFFISGPFDSKTRCIRIHATLLRHCGPDGFHFIIGTGEGYPYDEEYEESGEQEDDGFDV